MIKKNVLSLCSSIFVVPLLQYLFVGNLFLPDLFGPEDKFFFSVMPNQGSSAVKNISPTRQNTLKNTQQHLYRQRPKLEGVSFLLLCLTQVLFTSIRNGVSPETLKAERHLTRRTNSEYQMSEKECYKKSENFQTSFYAKKKEEWRCYCFSVSSILFATLYPSNPVIEEL